jgi:ATP/maltotriose-dependent transcriptional regulator MalT
VSRKRSEEKDLAAPFSDAPFVQELLTTQIEASVDVYRTPKLQLFEPITKRERDVLGLMTKGVSNQEIADALFVSVSTVKSHINSIFKKLEVSTREEAGELASQFQLLG